MKYGPRGRGLGTRFSFRWNNKVAWSTVCEPLNAGLPPKKHLHDLTHRARRSCPNRALTKTQKHTDTPHLVHRALPLLRESARIKGDKAGVRKQRPHATVASPPSVRRPRQRAPPAAAAAAAALTAYGIHPPEPAQHMRRRRRTCVHRRARWRVAPGGERKDALDTVA